MKRLIILSLSVILCITMYSQKTYTLSFDKNKYSFSVVNGVLSISSSEADIYYSSDSATPAFPYTACRILRPAGIYSGDYKVELKKELLYEGVEIEATPQLVTTNQKIEKESPIRIASKSVTTPVLFCGDIPFGTYNYAYFKVSPFVFDANRKKLYFVSSITIAISDNIAKDDKMAKDSFLKEGSIIRQVSPEEVKERIINPEELESLYPLNCKSLQSNVFPNSQEQVDYLIITKSNFVAQFQRIANWKIRKGLRAKVIAVEDIYENYLSFVGDTHPFSNVFKIKRCIYNYYTNCGLKYLLLGGDLNVIPSLKCKIKKMDGSNQLVDDYTICDDFYACLGNCWWSWDWNCNEIYGETLDWIDLTPNIYVSRIPVRTGMESMHFINKLLAYEKTPPTNIKANRMLMGGCSVETYGDVYNRANYMYNNYIQPYWNGTRHYLFDTGSNTGYTSFSATNLKNLINNGYQLIHIDTHGVSSGWNMQTTPSYDSIYSWQQTNTTLPIIVTTACLTNDFEHGKPCLSKSLMCTKQQSNNALTEYGALGYFGSSRDGWGYSSGADGYSSRYDGKFFQNLFSGQPYDAPYRLGAVAAKAKQDLIDDSDTDNAYRWLQFSINPLGDPEMPIYTDTPLNFTNVQLTINNNNSITVSTGLSGCTIAVTSVDNGESYFNVVKNMNSYTFTNLVSPFYVTITKHNYIPYQSGIMYANSVNSNHLFDGCNGNMSDEWELTYNLSGKTYHFTLNREHIQTDEKKNYKFVSPEWELIIYNATTGEKVYSEHVLEENKSVNTFGWKPGIYIVEGIINSDKSLQKIVVK